MKQQQEEVNKKPKQDKPKKKAKRRMKGSTNQEQQPQKPAENSCRTTKARLLQKKWLQRFLFILCSVEAVKKTVCTILVQLTFPPKRRHKEHIFKKPDSFTQILVVELKTH